MKYGTKLNTITHYIPGDNPRANAKAIWIDTEKGTLVFYQKHYKPMRIKKRG